MVAISYPFGYVYVGQIIQDDKRKGRSADDYKGDHIVKALHGIVDPCLEIFSDRY